MNYCEKLQKCVFNDIFQGSNSIPDGMADQIRSRNDYGLQELNETLIVSLKSKIKELMKKLKLEENNEENYKNIKGALT